MLRRHVPAAARWGIATLSAAILLGGCSGHNSAPVAAVVPAASASAVTPAAAAPSDDSSGNLVAAPVVPMVARAFARADTSSVVDDPASTHDAAGTRKKTKRLSGLTIVLDPGHNGGNSADPARLNAPVPAGGFTKPCNTAGAETNAGYPEHAFTWDVVTRAAALLRAEGATVVLTRHSDTGFGPCVNQRAAIGNAAHADAVVAVHADGAESYQTGFHVIAPALAPDHGNRAILAASWQLALDLHGAFHTSTGEDNATYVSGGLVRRSDLAGLNLSRVPAVFIECANMRNGSDAAKVTSAAWRQKAAAGIVGGLTRFLRR